MNETNIIPHTLTNAQHMHVQNPDTFYVPPDAELDDIKPGDYVKVCLEEQGERFWCKVTECYHGMQFDVTISNDVLSDGFKFGDKMTVNRYNVYDILKEADIPGKE